MYMTVNKGGIVYLCNADNQSRCYQSGNPKDVWLRRNHKGDWRRSTYSFRRSTPKSKVRLFGNF